MPAALAAMVACSFAWDDLDPRVSSSAGGASASSAVSVGGGVASSSSATTGTGGSGGEPVPGLVDRGLLVRYYLDEAAMGQDPSMVEDAAPDPLPLALDYGLAAGGGAPVYNLAFAEVDGRRGLAWSDKLRSGGASAPLGGTKLNALDGVTAATLEAVFDLDDGGGSGICSRLIQVGVDAFGTFTICLESNQHPSFRLNGSQVEEWSVDVIARPRAVLHLVMDTSQADPEARVRLFLDGTDVGPGDVMNTPPGDGDVIVLSGGEMAIGNRESGDASPQGTIFYAAVYGEALTDDEVAGNAQVLLSSDDPPPSAN